LTTNVSDRLRVTAVMSVAGAISVQNVYDVNCITEPGGDDVDVMEALAEWLDSAYTEIVGSLSNQLVFEEVRGFNITKDGPMPTVPWPTLTTGTPSGDYPPTAVAALVLFRTALAKVIGRKYIGILPESAMTAGLLISSVILELSAFALAIVAGPTPSGPAGAFDYGIRQSNGILRPVFTTVVRNVLAYQRRRKPGRGI